VQSRCTAQLTASMPHTSSTTRCRAKTDISPPGCTTSRQLDTKSSATADEPRDYYYFLKFFLAHQHKACRQLKIKQEMTAVGD